METIIAAYIGTEWAPVIAAVIALSSAVTMVLKSKVESPVGQALLDVLNIVSLNIFKNKNADR